MTRQSEQLEREAEEARAKLANSLDEIRARMTPGEIVDDVIEYARKHPLPSSFAISPVMCGKARCPF
jgi:hypothetical protein